MANCFLTRIGLRRPTPISKLDLNLDIQVKVPVRLYCCEVSPDEPLETLFFLFQNLADT